MYRASVTNGKWIVYYQHEPKRTFINHLKHLEHKLINDELNKHPANIAFEKGRNIPKDVLLCIDHLNAVDPNGLKDHLVPFDINNL